MSDNIPGPFFVKFNYLAPNEFENELNRVYKVIDEFFTKIERETKENLNGRGYNQNDFSRIFSTFGANYNAGNRNNQTLIGQQIHMSRFKEVPIAYALETKTEYHTVFTFGKEQNLEKIIEILDAVPIKEL